MREYRETEGAVPPPDCCCILVVILGKLLELRFSSYLLVNCLLCSYQPENKFCEFLLEFTGTVYATDLSYPTQRYVRVRHRFSFSSSKNFVRSDNEQKVQFVGLGIVLLFDVFRCVWLVGWGGGAQ